MRSNVLDELRHEIHSPLAALRNALYLISQRSDDFRVLEYVRLAEEEAQSIAGAFHKVSKTQEKAA